MGTAWVNGPALWLTRPTASPRPLTTTPPELPPDMGASICNIAVERDEAILRCRAAAEACREEGILLLARTDARPSRGFDEARRRVEAFVAEGADILFLDSPQDEAEIRASVEAAQGRPMIAVNAPAAKHFMPPDATLEKLGIRIVIYPQEMLAASVRAMRGALASLKGGERPPMATPAELGTAIRLPEYLAADARLAGGGG